MPVFKLDIKKEQPLKKGISKRGLLCPNPFSRELKRRYAHWAPVADRFSSASLAWFGCDLLVWLNLRERRSWDAFHVKELIIGDDYIVVVVVYVM